MTRILFGLLLFVIALVQATVLPRVNPTSLAPDFILIMLFLWSASHGIRESLAWIFFTGILLDVLTLDPLGTNGLALVIVVLLSGTGRQRIFQINVVVPVLLVFVATIVHGLVLYSLRGAPFGLFIVLQGLLHALLLPILYLISRVFSR
jgi:rod shape-determining protein MreD